MNMYLVSADVQTRKPVSGFLKAYAMYMFAFIMLLMPFAYLAIAHATPIYGSYPNYGFFKMSTYKTIDRGQIGMASERPYDADIVQAYTNVKNSTMGTTEMPSSVWPYGYNMMQNNWTGTWNNYVDVMHRWMDRTGDSVGQTYRYNQDNAFCTFWGQSTPCGQYAVIKYDIARWANYGTGLLRQRVVEHETGHAVGMNDYCAEDSIMNNGATYCSGGRWTAVMSYKPTDRKAVSTVYRGY